MLVKTPIVKVKLGVSQKRMNSKTFSETFKCCLTISLTKVYESFIAYLLLVKGFKLGTRNIINVEI